VTVVEHSTFKTENEAPLNQILDTPECAQTTLDTPISERNDPSYLPLETPRSRTELRATRAEPPIKRSRARVLSQDCADA
jgi:hypothetical protein